MRKLTSQISMALVCGILGFMLAYQFKVLMKQENIFNLSRENGTDITVEIEQYKKEKSALETKVSELQDKIKRYENDMASKSDSTKSLLKNLEDSRMLTGEVDVTGPGIIIYLTPDSKLFTNNNIGNHVTDKDLAYLVNELRFAGAEAISINDIRIVLRTGIRTAGNYILINDEKISPSSRIVIKAIGDKKLLYSAMGFPEVFTDLKTICEVKFEKSDSINIEKYSGTYKFNYAKPVKE